VLFQFFFLYSGYFEKYQVLPRRALAHLFIGMAALDCGPHALWESFGVPEVAECDVLALLEVANVDSDGGGNGVEVCIYGNGGMDHIHKVPL
jgi:hypothetical protein